MSNSNKKKNKQLGMNHSTASHRLVKDILFNFIVKSNENICYRCGEKMSREDFSIEHINHWLDSSDPIGNFFDLNNISFSHLSCNIKNSRRKIASCGTESAYNRGCRCDECKTAHAKDSRKRYNYEKRRARYLLHEKISS